MSCHKPLPPKQPDTACGILFLGTSLTAGYGLSDDEEAFPELISDTLSSLGQSYDVRNAGVPGETSAGLLDRITRVLESDTVPRRLIVVETGANDMLQSLSPVAFGENLNQILDIIHEARPAAGLLLLRVDPGAARSLPGQGANGGQIMDTLTQIAKKRNIPVVEDLLEGVRFDLELTQPDRLHPNALGQARLVKNIWPELEKSLNSLGCHK